MKVLAASVLYTIHCILESAPSNDDSKQCATYVYTTSCFSLSLTTQRNEQANHCERLVAIIDSGVYIWREVLCRTQGPIYDMY